MKSIKDFKLSTLLELTNAINNNLPEELLFTTFGEILQEKLYIGKAVIFLKQDDEWSIPLKYGNHRSSMTPQLEEELRGVRDIKVLDTSDEGNPNSFDVVIPVYHHQHLLAYLFLGDLDENALGTSPIIKHLSFIQTLANITSVAVENRRLERKNIERERMLQELHLASQMQSLLLPKVLPNNDRLKVSAYYQPHSEVGGDFYDIITVSEDEIIICMADVSGKGMSAAIIMANFQANLRALLKVETDLVKLTELLNEIVWDNAMGERYITCFLAKYNCASHELQYVNAAHPAGMLIHDGQATELPPTCTGIGMFEEIPNIKMETKKVDPKTLFILYTDGISETENEEDLQFEQVDMLTSFIDAGSQEIDKVNELIIERLDAFRNGVPYIDDVALVSCLLL